jgi:hypothetical protein
LVVSPLPSAAQDLLSSGADLLEGGKDLVGDVTGGASVGDLNEQLNNAFEGLGRTGEAAAGQFAQTLQDELGITGAKLVLEDAELLKSRLKKFADDPTNPNNAKDVVAAYTQMMYDSYQTAEEVATKTVDEAIMQAARATGQYHTNRDAEMDRVRGQWTHVVFSEEIAHATYTAVATKTAVSGGAAFFEWLMSYLGRNIGRMADEVVNQVAKDLEEEPARIKGEVLKQIEQYVKQQASYFAQHGSFQSGGSIRIPGVKVPVKVGFGNIAFKHWIGTKDRKMAPLPNTHIFYFAWNTDELGGIDIGPNSQMDPSGQKRPKQVRRYLKLANKTEERIRVWLQYRSVSQGGEWRWYPGEPGSESNALRYTFEPDESNYLNDSGRGVRVAASRVRIWAESETGRRWTKNLDSDLWLVEESGGSRAYYAEKIGTFTHTFRAREGPRTFRDRLVEVDNQSDIPIVVEARALTELPDGRRVWRTAEKTTVAANQKVKLKDGAAWPLRGSAMNLWAEDAKKRFRWDKHKSSRIGLVDSRGYRGEDIGRYVYKLEVPKKP